MSDRKPLWPKSIEVIGGTGEYESGKAQPLTAKVLTPTGWRQIGDLQVGDQVCDPDGGVANVTGVYPQGIKQVYNVTFTDGAATECCDEHLWLVQHPNHVYRGQPGRVMSLREIRTHKKPQQFRIPLPQPAVYQSAAKPKLDPYLMGVLLGDGCFRNDSVELSSPEPELLTEVKRRLPSGVSLVPKTNEGIDYRISTESRGGAIETRSTNLVKQAIKEYSLDKKLSVEKHIPDDYMYADEESREELVQGLCDTDGYALPGSCEFSTSSEVMAQQVQTLVRSLGGTSRLTSRIPAYSYNGEKRRGHLSYRMAIRMPEGKKAFKLSRKAAIYNKETVTSPARLFRSIELAGEKECVCIAVNTKRHLYITDDFIVTHNTTFGLTICPGPETLYYDFEKSGASYEADLGFTRVDVPAEMQRRFPKGYKPVDVFNWWLSHVRSLQAGQYRVIVADPASDIEQGLADWVAANPKHFGKTPGQYIKMSGIMWGDMKSYWKAILADIAARCETFYFTTHMSNVWKGDRPSKERKAKGKETLFEMASLYLRFERKKDIEAVPSAVVLKSRLSKITVDDSSEDGEVVSIPLLPPRLPKATPAAIRKYMNNPPDYKNLKPEEMVGEVKLTEDEKLLLRAEIASAERDTAMVVSASEGKRLGGVRVGPRVSTSAVADDEGSASAAQAVEEDAEVEQEIETEPEAEVPHGEELAEAVEDAAATVTPIDDRYPSPDSPVSKGQLGSLNNAIAKFLQQYPDKQESIDRAVKKRNPKATHVSELTNGQAEDMEASLLRILNGPHETPETAKLEKAAAESQPSTPDTGKGAATKARTKRS